MPHSLLDALDVVKERVARAHHLLVALDFDGTLAPIAQDPEEVFLAPAVRDLLLALAGRERVSLAIVSGRSLADLEARIGLPGLVYAGNHGLEITGRDIRFVEATAAASSQALQALAAELAAELAGIPGVFVENKGLTISVHYRLVAPEVWEQILRVTQSALAATNLFALTLGERVYEIRPRTHWSKGHAVLWIKEHLDRPDALTIFMGDDTSDEEAFALLAGGITAKVRNASDSQAHYSLSGPAEVQQFLAWLVKTLARDQGGRRPPNSCQA